MADRRNFFCKQNDDIPTPTNVIRLKLKYRIHRSMQKRAGQQKHSGNCAKAQRAAKRGVRRANEN